MNTYNKVAVALFLGFLMVVCMPVRGAEAGLTIRYSTYPSGRQHIRHGYSYQPKRVNYRPNKHYRKTHKKSYVGPSRHDHDYVVYGFTYDLPFGSKSVKVHGTTYRFHNGQFYKKCTGRGYDLVPAPHGAHVYRLPSGYDIKYTNGKKYYHYNGTYFLKDIRRGYNVVGSPYKDKHYAYKEAYCRR